MWRSGSRGASSAAGCALDATKRPIPLCFICPPNFPERTASPSFLCSSFAIPSSPSYRWSHAAFNNPTHGHASRPQATPLMPHTHTQRQCQFPRLDPCLCSPDWIRLVQYGAATLGLRGLHGPAGWKKAPGSARNRLDQDWG